jgi:outer membrane protein
MKHSIKSLVALAAFGAFALVASAQPAIKLAIVDMAKLYDSHYKTVEQNAKIQSDDQKATEEVDKMNKEGNALVEEYKALSEAANNPALTNDAKVAKQQDAQKKLEAIQRKQQEIQQFIGNTRQILNQRFQTFKNVMLEEISKVAGDVAKRKGANLVIDKSGPSFFGISNVIYADAAFDITDDVMKEINKDRPAGAPTAPTTSAGPGPGGPAAAPAADPNKVVVPGLGTKK